MLFMSYCEPMFYVKDDLPLDFFLLVILPSSVSAIATPLLQTQ